VGSKAQPWGKNIRGMKGRLRAFTIKAGAATDLRFVRRKKGEKGRGLRGHEAHIRDGNEPQAGRVKGRKVQARGNPTTGRKLWRMVRLLSPCI